MAFDGSGNYTRNNGTFTGASVWANDAAAGTKIITANHDAHDQDIANALTQCLTKTGVSTPTANLPMGGFKLTGLGAGTALTDSATVQQAQSGASRFAITGGTSTAYTLTLTPAIDAYVEGASYIVKFNATCGASPTININSLGAVNLKSTGANLTAGQIVINRFYLITYSSTASAFFVQDLAVQSLSSYTPTITAGGTLSYTGVTINYAKYHIYGNTVFFSVNFTGATGGAGLGSNVYFTLPSTASALNKHAAAAYQLIGGTYKVASGRQQSTTLFAIDTYDGSNLPLSTTIEFSCTGHYEI